MAFETNVEEQEFIQANRREVSEEQVEKFERYAAEIFSAFGMDLNTSATWRP